MSKSLEQQMAESATGIREKEGAPFVFEFEGEPVSLTKARRLIRDGEWLVCPTAGAGSYRKVAELLGWTWLSVEDWTSSAGDWIFRLRNGKMMWQENCRFGGSGFRYSVGRPL